MKGISSVILCGGQCRRMGREKAELMWNGRELLDVIAGNLAGLGDVFLSADRKTRFAGKPYPVVEDRYPDCGPLGGIYTALTACGTPFLFVVSCDMPFVTGDAGKLLHGRVNQENAAVPRETGGRIHPLCAVYRQNAAPILLRQLRTGNYCMRDALNRLQTVYVPAEELPGGERTLCNINTPEDYMKVSRTEC